MRVDQNLLTSAAQNNNLTIESEEGHGHEQRIGGRLAIDRDQKWCCGDTFLSLTTISFCISNFSNSMGFSL